MTAEHVIPGVARLGQHGSPLVRGDLRPVANRTRLRVRRDRRPTVPTFVARLRARPHQACDRLENPHSYRKFPSAIINLTASRSSRRCSSRGPHSNATRLSMGLGLASGTGLLIVSETRRILIGRAEIALCRRTGGEYGRIARHRGGRRGLGGPLPTQNHTNRGYGRRGAVTARRDYLCPVAHHAVCQRSTPAPSQAVLTGCHPPRATRTRRARSLPYSPRSGCAVRRAPAAS